MSAKRLWSVLFYLALAGGLPLWSSPSPAHAQAASEFFFSAGQCSQNEMFKTCNELIGAFQQLQAGDTLYLRGGTYYIPRLWIDTLREISGLNQRILGTGLEGAPITVRPAPGEQVIFRGRGIFFYDTHHWTIEGIVFENITNDAGVGTSAIVLGAHEVLGDTYVDQDGARRPRTVAPHHIKILDCTFHNGSMDGVAIHDAWGATDESSGLWIEGNHFENLRSRKSGQDGAIGVGVRYIGRRIFVRNNTFVDLSSDGIHLGAQSYRAGTDIRDITIEGNQFWVTRDELTGKVPYRNVYGDVITALCTDDGRDDWDENTRDYCAFTDNVGENGIDIKKVNPNGGMVVVRGNVVHGFRGTTPAQDASGANGEGIAIHCDGQHVVLENNLLYDNEQNLTVGPGTGGSEQWQVDGVADITIRNNILRGSTKVESQGLVLYKVRSSYVYNNTFVGHHRTFTNWCDESTGACLFSIVEFAFKDNLIDGGEFYISTSRTGLPNQTISIDYNAWSGVDPKGNGEYVPALFQGLHDQGSHSGATVDLGMDQGTSALLPGSPLIDAGTPVDVVSDYAGTARPQGDGFDIGAFEFIGESTFADVPLSHPYYREIEALYQAGYTAGCNTDPLMYCPDQAMNRAESAVFVERGIHGTSGMPSQPTSQTFADLPLDSWAAKWAEALWQDGYTAGCGTDPLLYCPWQGHTRAEGCVLYLHMLNGPTYEPPQPSQQTFADVPLEAWYARWVQAAYDAGLITACQTTPDLRFCPNDPLPRALAAYMMVQAKGLENALATPLLDSLAPPG